MISFLRRNSSTLGLDIGSGFVKAALVEHGGPEPVVAKLAYTPLAPDAIVEGEVMDPQLVVDTVRALLTELGLKAPRVVSAVGGRDVIVKRIPMDRMKAEDAREVIRWEAEQYVPFDMANVQLDFQILDPGADGLQMQVLLVAAKREVVDQKLALLGEAGLTPSIVDVDAFALMNAFAYNYPEAMQGVSALVNVGHEVATVNVVQDGALVLTRDIPFGARRLRENLRRLKGLTAEEAEAVIQGRSERQDEFLPLLTQGGEELALGVERAVAFLSLGDAGSGIGRVYLSGGCAALPGLAAALSERLHARTETANPFQRLQLRPDAALLFPLDELAPMLMLPVGLALRTTA